MADTTSATGGVLQALPLSATDDDVISALHDIVADVTGLTGDLIRPRWQPKPPKQPEFDVDWCAIGIMNHDPEANASISHSGAGDGTSTVTEHEDLDCLASFYGPSSAENAKAFRQAMQLAQNRDSLRAIGVALKETSGPRRVPEVQGATFVQRNDIEVVLTQETRSEFTVRNFLAASGRLVTDSPDGRGGQLQTDPAQDGALTQPPEDGVLTVEDKLKRTWTANL